ncbi:MAG: MBL fold metallo-hydrolase [Saprospiraceae bacterium]|jgi:glyoxylase-like metal-dependent hydrolase (beta-lactamase superfamily II)|nr:MBL fold metallo-hydrolase [Saprospiraceae bacterium]
MAEVLSFTYNPFSENTYVVYDDTKECVIFDPGCYTSTERNAFQAKIEELGLKPVRLINTHCHIDHVFGNALVNRAYGLELEIHRGEIPVLESVPMVGQMYGIPIPDPSPAATKFIEEDDVISFGNTILRAIFTPGHSPASLSFFCEQDRFLIAGDVLFEGSIGRTDLPGGDHTILINVIKEKLFPLGDDVVVYPGHGGATTIQAERLTNPFLT